MNKQERIDFMEDSVLSFFMYPATDMDKTLTIAIGFIHVGLEYSKENDYKLTLVRKSYYEV